MIDYINELRNRIINGCWSVGREGMKSCNVIDEPTIDKIADELLEEVNGGSFVPVKRNK